MEHIILAILDQEPMHGYELHLRLDKLPGVSKIWNLKQALFYAKLERLEETGYIQRANRPDDAEESSRIVFQLTPAGKKSLMTWITDPVRKARDLQQVFLGKLIVARRYGLHKTLELVRNQRVVCQSWLHHLEVEMPEKTIEQLDEYLVHTFKIHRDHATLSWLDEIESQLLQTESWS